MNFIQEYETDSGEDADSVEKEVDKHNEGKVLVFFTINRKIIGKRKLVLPEGGFFPSVGIQITSSPNIYQFISDMQQRGQHLM